MLTIEFETEAENGNIEIPEKYRHQLKGKLQVVVTLKETKKSEEESHNSFFLKRAEFDQERNLTEDITDENFINWLLKNPVKVDKTIPFLTRDEIYDRKL